MSHKYQFKLNRFHFILNFLCFFLQCFQLMLECQILGPRLPAVCCGSATGTTEHSGKNYTPHPEVSDSSGECSSSRKQRSSPTRNILVIFFSCRLLLFKFPSNWIPLNTTSVSGHHLHRVTYLHPETLM